MSETKPADVQLEVVEPVAQPAAVTVHVAEEQKVTAPAAAPVVPLADAKVMGATGICQRKSALQIALSVVLLGFIAGLYSTKETGVKHSGDELFLQFMWFSIAFGTIQFVSGWTLIQESFMPSTIRFTGETVSALLKVSAFLGLLALGFAVKIIHLKGLTGDVVTAAVSFAIINALYNVYLAYGHFNYEDFLAINGFRGFLAFFQTSLGTVLIGLVAGNFDDGKHFGHQEINSYILLSAVMQLLSGLTWWKFLNGKSRSGIDTVVVTLKLAAATGLLALAYASKAIDHAGKNDEKLTPIELAIFSFAIINGIFSLVFAWIAQNGTKAAEAKESYKKEAILQIALSTVLFGLIGGHVQNTYNNDEWHLGQKFALVFAVVDFFAGVSLFEFATGRFHATTESLTTLLKISTGLGLLALGFSSASIEAKYKTMTDLEVTIHSFVIINAGYVFYLSQKFQSSGKSVTLDNEFAKYISLAQFILSIILCGLLGGTVYQGNNSVSYVLALVFAVIMAASGVALLEQSFFSTVFTNNTPGSATAVLKVASATGLLALGFACQTIDSTFEKDRDDLTNTILSFVIFNALWTVFVTYLSGKNLIYGANAYSLTGKTSEIEAYAQFALGVLLIGLIGGKLNRKGYQLSEDAGIEAHNTIWYALLFAVLQAGSGYVSFEANFKASSTALLRVAAVVGFIALAFAARDIKIHGETTKMDALGVTISAFTIFNALYTVYLSVIKRNHAAAVPANKSMGVIQSVLGIILFGLVAGLANKKDFEDKGSWLLARTLFYVLIFAVLEATAGLTMYYQSSGRSNLSADAVIALNRVTSSTGFLALGFACKSIDFGKNPDLETAIYAFTIINAIITNFIDNKVATFAMAEAAPGQTKKSKIVAVFHIFSSIILFALIAGYLNKDINFENTASDFTIQTALLYGLFFAVLQLQSGFFQVSEAFGSTRVSSALAVNVVVTLVGLLAVGFVCQAIKEHPGEEIVPLLRAVYAFIFINTFVTFIITRKVTKA